jgi:hypothetical protein
MVEELLCIIINPRFVVIKEKDKTIINHIEESKRKPTSYIGDFHYPEYPFTTSLLWKYPLLDVWIHNGDLYNEMWYQFDKNPPANWDYDSGKSYPIEEIRRMYYSKPKKSLIPKIHLNSKEHGYTEIDHIWRIGD